VLAVALVAHAQIVDSSFSETSSPVDDIHDHFCCCCFVFEGLLFSPRFDMYSYLNFAVYRQRFSEWLEA